MKCVKGHQAQKRLDKQVDPETIPPRAPNGMKLKRYNITKQQNWTKVRKLLTLLKKETCFK